MMMEKKTVDLEAAKKQCVKLKADGLKQKEIAIRLGVSAKAVGHWLRDSPVNDLHTIRAGITKRLKAAVLEPETGAADVHKLTICLAVIDKQIEKIER